MVAMAQTRLQRVRGVLLAAACSGGLVAHATAPDLAPALREHLDRLGAHPVVGNEPLGRPRALEAFYRLGGHRAVWVSAAGRPTDAGRALLEFIRRVAAEGLDPADYHAGALERAFAALGRRPGTAAAVVEPELLLTDAFLQLAGDLSAGRVPPRRLDPEAGPASVPVDPIAALHMALATGEVAATLRELTPAAPGYASLRAALARYRALEAQGGWPAVPWGPSLRRSDYGTRVERLRRRLAVTGDLEPAPRADAARFDADLEAAVRRFQRRHGLRDDGVVGAATLAALNVPADARVRQIAANLERWRWLPEALGERHVLVNIAGYTLEAVEHGRPALAMRVIVGRPYRRTPVFSDRIRYLVLNPSWNVPHTIAVEDILPEAQRDPAYLERMGFTVLRGWGENAEALDPRALDWSRLGPERFPYRLRQEPGPRNALGRLKFMFPNAHNVYLHDTPTRALFDRERRGFSSGCIRVERPLGLAAYLLRARPEWDADALRDAIDAGETRAVHLEEPVPVHIVYRTAWVDERGVLQLRRDVYERDGALIGALTGEEETRADSPG